MTLSHAFVVAAYGKSPFLEHCLRSLHNQTRNSPIVVSTSTPFDGLQEVAACHGASLSIHRNRNGIGADWNAALRATDARLVTIAHQDDVYEPRFAAAAIDAHARAAGAAFSFCDANEIVNDGRPRKWKANQLIKQLIIGAAYLGRTSIQGPLRKRILLGLGNPIICSTVTIDRAVARDFGFREDLKTNMDWLAWIELAERSPVLRIRGPMVNRRVHSTSETASCIADGTREAEDRLVFDTMWPKPVSATLRAFYKMSYGAYSN